MSWKFWKKPPAHVHDWREDPDGWKDVEEYEGIYWTALGPNRMIIRTVPGRQCQSITVVCECGEA